jgi:lysyl-tRNA synthetase class 2
MLARQTAIARARLYRVVREFFHKRDHLEVDTPNLARTLIPESHIPVFQTSRVHPWEEPETYYLIPSPEVHMKQLLAAGYGSIYRLGPAFRNAENRSRIHSPEFTMLEWYTVDADYSDLIATTGELLQTVAHEMHDVATSVPDLFAREPAIISVEEALARYVSAPERVFDTPNGMRVLATRLEMEVRPHETEEELFQRILLTYVEPNLPTDRPVFLCDYPSLVPSLAAAHSGRPSVRERWELYLNGVEVANCYTEERNRESLEHYLTSQLGACTEENGPFAPPAYSLLAFENAPPCSGAALGIDRFLMALLGRDEITGVIFNEEL